MTTQSTVTEFDAAEKKQLVEGVIKLLVESARRRKAAEQQLEKSFGIEALLQHPDETAFYAVIKRMQDICSDKDEFVESGLEVHFHKESLEKWFMLVAGKAPRYGGRKILELLAEQLLKQYTTNQVHYDFFHLVDDLDVRDQISDAFTDALFAVDDTPLPSSIVTGLETSLRDCLGYEALPSRVQNVLINDNKQYLGDVMLSGTESHFLGLPNFSHKSLSDLQAFLRANGRSLAPGRELAMTDELQAYCDWKSNLPQDY